MGVLIATVGGLGLMGTMGMNVLERTARDRRITLDRRREWDHLPTGAGRGRADRADQLGTERAGGHPNHPVAGQVPRPGPDDRANHVHFLHPGLIYLARDRVGALRSGQPVAGAQRRPPDSPGRVGL